MKGPYTKKAPTTKEKRQKPCPTCFQPMTLVHPQAVNELNRWSCPTHGTPTKP